MPRGRAWTPAEIRCLLALVGACGEVALLMASTSRPNEALWRDISRGLAAAGYSRSVTQCRSKWKALKQAFYSERETRRQAGRHSPRVPPHYRAMKSIWKAAGRPVFGERRLPDRVKLPPRKRGLPLEDHAPSSPEQQDLVTCTDTPGTLSPQCAKDEPASRPGSPLLPSDTIKLSLGRVRAPEPGVHVPRSCPAAYSGTDPALPRCLHAQTSARKFATKGIQAARLDQVAGAPPAPAPVAHVGHPFPPLPHLGFHAAFPALKQEIAEGKAGCPGETALGMGAGNLPVAARALGSPRRAATSEQTAASDEASGAGLQGAGVAALLQSVQQLLVQILQTSQQQQVLLESLASDTVSHLHVISDNLVQVGETLHELLLRAHARAGALPSPLDRYISRMPLFEGGPRPALFLGVPCSPGAPQDSPCHKEEPLGSPATGFAPP